MKTTMSPPLLERLEAVPVPRVRKCAIAYSGGLDSTLGIELLRRVYRADTIIPITVDVGQGGEEIELAERRSSVLRIQPLLIDAREEFSREWLSKAILANGSYWGLRSPYQIYRFWIYRQKDLCACILSVTGY